MSDKPVTMRSDRMLLPVLLGLAVACTTGPDRTTLAGLRDVEPDLTEVRIAEGLDQAMEGYRRYLEEAPASALTPEAMRRLADLNLEKAYGLLGAPKDPDDSAALPAPERVRARNETSSPLPAAVAVAVAEVADHSESEEDFERRATGTTPSAPQAESLALEPPDGRRAEPRGPLEALALYDEILANHPSYPQNDQVLYQKARALDELGRNDEAIAVIERLIDEYPGSRHIDEVQFRRAEYFFVRKRYLDAEEAYSAIVSMGPASTYYELALYKVGWTLYKQELHEDALDAYIALLDYKLSIGHDFDQSTDESDARRLSDTFRVISLSFSNLGGPGITAEYFAEVGPRPYEDRIYSHLGEFYLEKRRYDDAASAYRTFVGLHPLHRASPHFGMRVVEIYEAGGFPRLVLDSKKKFAATYGLQSEYWRHFDPADSPDVLRYLKSNLEDLASHYHALYQDGRQQGVKSEETSAHFNEASRWYAAFLVSFPEDPSTPPINRRLADLLLEHGAFARAAREYERTAYDYPAHEQAAAAGHAAIFAHRERLKAGRDNDESQEAADARRAAVESTLRFVDAFPHHEQAATVLGAAVDDLYEMKQFEVAISAGRRLIAEYPDAEDSILRSAWSIVAHSSFDLEAYEDAERAYGKVLSFTTGEDDPRQAVVDNLAASIYKQGERASREGDPATAARHFLRLAEAAPTSEIRPVAEYDAAAALIALEDWVQATTVLESFRRTFPDHELHRESTKQLAFVHREQGNLARAAAEYERVAEESDDPELRREALLIAGSLYEDSDLHDRALATYLLYVSQFTQPVEPAVETRFRIAEIYKAMGDQVHYHEQLRRIVQIDDASTSERTPRIRLLAARSALALAELHYQRFEEVELKQPFARNLAEKQKRVDVALDAFGALVDYEVGEITAAATFYMAEIYYGFSQSLLESERPAELAPSELAHYEMVLEEEAFPFEERAIDVHEKNLELMSTGVYNPWIEKSIAKLAELVPGRYAKSEASSGLVSSIDAYAYRKPSSPVAPLVSKPQMADGAPAEDGARLEERPDHPAAAAPAQAPSTQGVPDARRGSDRGGDPLSAGG